MKFGQLIDYHVKKIFCGKSCRKSDSDTFFFQKAFEVKRSGQHLNFNKFWYSSTWTYNKSKLCKTSDC